MEDSERFTVEGLTVRLIHDSDCSSPRENDNLGVMVCWHRGYNLGDYEYRNRPFETPQEFREWADSKENGVAIILPLYLYDHSGITMNTTGFSCPWDSGQVGYIYITREKIKKEYSVKRISKQLLEKVRKSLVCEVEEYDRFITGECYGYVVEDFEGNDLDSCWGFIGYEWAKQAATDAAKACAESKAKEHAVQLEREATAAGDVPDVEFEIA